MRFQRHKRLNEASAYKRVFNANKRSVDNNFLILAHANNGCTYSRLGLAVAKKHLKNASDRNAVKRIIRESFREDATHLKGFDFVVLLKKNAANIKQKSIKSILKQTLEKDKVIKHILIKLVSIYRRFISPFLGMNCRFYPTCSEYCEHALHQHGVLKGSALSIKRILSCQPFSKGGYDPVPGSGEQ